MNELEYEAIGDLRTLMNDERVINKEDFYKFINLLKVLPECLDMAKKND